MGRYLVHNQRIFHQSDRDFRGPSVSWYEFHYEHKNPPPLTNQAQSTPTPQEPQPTTPLPPRPTPPPIAAQAPAQRKPVQVRLMASGVPQAPETLDLVVEEQRKQGKQR